MSHLHEIIIDIHFNRGYNADRGIYMEHQVPYQSPFNFTVLSMDGSEFQRIQSTGTIMDVFKDGMEIMTEYPVQPGQVLQWDDRHKPNWLHIALVKWSQKEDDRYRAGLTFLLR